MDLHRLRQATKSYDQQTAAWAKRAAPKYYALLQAKQVVAPNEESLQDFAAKRYTASSWRKINVEEPELLRDMMDALADEMGSRYGIKVERD